MAYMQDYNLDTLLSVLNLPTKGGFLVHACISILLVVTCIIIVTLHAWFLDVFISDLGFNCSISVYRLPFKSTDSFLDLMPWFRDPLQCHDYSCG